MRTSTSDDGVSGIAVPATTPDEFGGYFDAFGNYCVDGWVWVDTYKKWWHPQTGEYASGEEDDQQPKTWSSVQIRPILATATPTVDSKARSAAKQHDASLAELPVGVATEYKPVVELEAFLPRRKRKRKQEPVLPKNLEVIVHGPRKDLVERSNEQVLKAAAHVTGKPLRMPQAASRSTFMYPRPEADVRTVEVDGDKVRFVNVPLPKRVDKGLKPAPVLAMEKVGMKELQWRPLAQLQSKMRVEGIEAFPDGIVRTYQKVIEEAKDEPLTTKDEAQAISPPDRGRPGSTPEAPPQSGGKSGDENRRTAETAKASPKSRSIADASIDAALRTIQEIRDNFRPKSSRESLSDLSPRTQGVLEGIRSMTEEDKAEYSIVVDKKTERLLSLAVDVAPRDASGTLVSELASQLRNSNRRVRKLEQRIRLASLETKHHQSRRETGEDSESETDDIEALHRADKMRRNADDLLSQVRRALYETERVTRTTLADILATLAVTEGSLDATRLRTCNDHVEQMQDVLEDLARLQSAADNIKANYDDPSAGCSCLPLRRGLEHDVKHLTQLVQEAHEQIISTRKATLATALDAAELRAENRRVREGYEDEVREITRDIRDKNNVQVLEDEISQLKTQVAMLKADRPEDTEFLASRIPFDTAQKVEGLSRVLEFEETRLGGDLRPEVQMQLEKQEHIIRELRYQLNSAAVPHSVNQMFDRMGQATTNVQDILRTAQSRLVQ
ncbi:MAG: hypothetical protein KVP17_001603 [Porospora cf. gigantea B]|uniref:uncharacterized protein n=1 Tax=Porospora cf. gigantea B TaxID=2853592 RepID=UPI0035718481|nr:MAG: hypothetical protein KVP17_001603 [Porospora cf. gigantea B]